MAERQVTAELPAREPAGPKLALVVKLAAALETSVRAEPPVKAAKVARSAPAAPQVLAVLQVPAAAPVRSISAEPAALAELAASTTAAEEKAANRAVWVLPVFRAIRTTVLIRSPLGAEFPREPTTILDGLTAAVWMMG
jgi:hypothetical protein